MATPALDPEQIAPTEDGWMDPATEAAHSVAIESNTDFTSHETRVAEPLDSSLATGSEPPASVPIKSNWAPIMEFTSADIFQHSPLGDMLDSLKSLSLSGDPRPNYVRLDGKGTTKKFVPHPPPT